MNLEAFLARLKNVRRNGSSYQALCPAHADRDPSLSINVRGGKILFHCHAGCLQEAVLAALGVEACELSLGAGDGPKRAKPKIVATYDYVGEDGGLLFQVIRREPKGFRQRRPDGRGRWIWNLDGTRRVLYRLPEVLAEDDVVVVEGERDCETARKMEIVATCNPGGAGKWREEFSECLRGKKLVVIIPDADEPGRKHAQQVAQSLCGKVESLKVLKLPGAKDFTEWVEHGGTLEQLITLVKDTPEWKLEVVDGARLLDQVVAYIRCFVFLSDSQKRVAALFVAHTHTFDVADSTPYLAITSAEKQSGKTRLLEVFELVVANPWSTGKATAAVLIRKIDAEQPTLLLDESDAAFGGEEEYAQTLRGVLNTGHRRGGTASCCVGQGTNITFRDFSTFCPKAIAGIGKLPGTVADRAIPIRLKRAARGEKVERFRRRIVESEAERLKAQLEAWCVGIIPTLRDARPQLPEELTDRQQDGAEPLLAIADLAGGEWPQAARRALIELCTEARADDGSNRVRLLNDIQQIFDARGVDRLASADLAAALAEIETSPWAEWSKGKPLSVGKLAWQLHPFGVAPHNVRIGETVKKGYELEDFADAWERYLPPVSAHEAPQNATPLQTEVTTSNEKTYFCDKSATENEPVAPQKCEIANKDAACSVVALLKPPTGAGKRGIEEEL